MTRDPPRFDRWLAVLAVMLLVLSATVPRVVYSFQHPSYADQTIGYGTLQLDGGNLLREWAQILGAATTALLVLWVFTRWAGASDKYEPAKWTRDLRWQALACFPVFLETLLWGEGAYKVGKWNRLTDVEQGVEFREGLQFGWGAYLILVAAIVLLFAYKIARDRLEAPESLEVTPETE